MPLCVDLDGTLVRSDTLMESVAALLKARPWLAAALPFWLAGGRAAFKRRVDREARLDVALLPYDAELVRSLEERRGEGRRIVLATAADADLARRVADHLGLFDEVVASDGAVNLKREEKARTLVARFGDSGFDYVGEDRHDLPVWRHAREAWVVGDGALARRVRAMGKPTHVIARERRALATLARAIRVHQWAKNLLVFVPVVTAHRLLAPGAAAAALLAFAAFSVAASAVYIANDLLDLQDDRRHPTKRARAIAAGDLGIPAALALLVALMAGAAALAAALPVGFRMLLAAYVVTSLAYSAALKRVPILDVFVLAALYTLRILCGAAAIPVPVSQWLLAFSLFAFLSLALVKRYVEVRNVAAREETRVGGRGYDAHDAELLGMLGSASAYLSVLVFALYVSSPQVASLYASPALLWFACPLLLYWMSRVWFLAHRGRVHEDPLVFALRDPASYATGLLILALMIAAT